MKSPNIFTLSGSNRYTHSKEIYKDIGYGPRYLKCIYWHRLDLLEYYLHFDKSYRESSYSNKNVTRHLFVSLLNDTRHSNYTNDELKEMFTLLYKNKLPVVSYPYSMKNLEPPNFFQSSYNTYEEFVDIILSWNKEAWSGVDSITKEELQYFKNKTY